jgi:short-subunit dehydrogenase
MLISGKRVLITGAGQGMGRLMVWRFAEKGAFVVATDLKEELLKEIEGEASRRKVSLLTHPLDVTKTDEILSLRQRIERELGGVDILVNNAGVVFGGPFSEVPLELHNLTLKVNLLGVVNTTYTFLPLLLKQPEGAIVNMASASAFIALPLATTYAASKWGVVGFSDSLRIELRARGHRHIRVISICPSYVNTGMFAGATPPKQIGMLRPESVVARVIRAVEQEKTDVYIPGYVRAAPFFRGILPKRWFEWFCWKLGIYGSMKGWRGRGEDSSYPSTEHGEPVPLASPKG